MNLAAVNDFVRRQLQKFDYFLAVRFLPLERGKAKATHAEREQAPIPAPMHAASFASALKKIAKEEGFNICLGTSFDGRKTPI